MSSHIFHYILEVVKKQELKKKNKKQTPVFWNAFNSSLKITQKGKKKNEITKAVQSKKSVVTRIAVNPTVKNNELCSTITHPNAVLNDTLDLKRTHNFTQANTRIVSPGQSTLPTQTFLSCFQSQSQRSSLNFQSPSINDLNQGQSNLVYGDPCSYRTN